MARPRKAAGDEAVQVTIPRWAFDLVDGHIAGRASAAHLAKDDGGPTARELAAGRSTYIARLIDAALGFEARHPVSVKLSAPVHGGASELEAVARWIEETEAALNESAPAAVKAALTANETMRNLVRRDGE